MWFQGNLYQNRLHPQFFLLFWNKIADAACISLILAFNKIALLSKFSYRDETIIKPPWIFQLQLIQWTFFSLAEQGGRGSACGHRMGWHRLRSAVPSSPPPQLHVDQPVSLSREAAADPSPRLHHIQARLTLMSPVAAEIQCSSQQPQHVNGAPSDSQNQPWSIHPPEGEFLPLIYERGSSQQFQAGGLKPETWYALTNPSNLC